MEVRPVLLNDRIRVALDPSMGPITWGEVEGWIADHVACVWQVGDQAWLLTFANADDEIEILAAGGKGSWQVGRPFEAAMRAFPAHAGMTLRIEGRKGWARIFPHWQRENLPGGAVLLTTRV